MEGWRLIATRDEKKLRRFGLAVNGERWRAVALVHTVLVQLPISIRGVTGIGLTKRFNGAIFAQARTFRTIQFNGVDSSTGSIDVAARAGAIVATICFRELMSARGNEPLHLLGPVQHDVDLVYRGIGVDVPNHKKPSVTRNVVAYEVVAVSKEWCLEEETGRSGNKTRPAGDVYSHHFVPDAIKQFPPATRPSRLAAAFGRNQPFPTRPQERLDVDLLPARLVRNIRQPAAVGRALRITFIRRPPEKHLSCTVFFKRQRPDIRAGISSSRCKRHPLSILRPRSGRLISIFLRRQPFFFSRGIRRLPEQIADAKSGCSVRDARSVWRPDGKLAAVGSARQPGQGRAREVVYPNARRTFFNLDRRLMAIR